MKLSIIIVNYNVEKHLQQCLISVKKAVENTDRIYGENSCETFVVDNNSSDNSCLMVKNLFPEIVLIENRNNDGFSIANNIALQKATGEYSLLLNPDTLVAEDTFARVLQFMDNHPDAGAAGVKMLDSQGNFHPESKRSIPTAASSFFKIFGFSSLFPHSKKFGQYQLTYLDKDQNHEIEVIAGAFMIIRKKVLEKTGLLDESFFMYGEDIDLSYRILKAGYKNYYIAEAPIIHYKGESTKKNSLKYVYVFYNAMIIFARKHYKSGFISPFLILLYSGVIIKAIMSAITVLFKALLFPVIDFILFFSAFSAITFVANQNGNQEWDFCNRDILFVSSGLYVLVWIVSFALSRGYRHNISVRQFAMSSGISMFMMLITTVFIHRLILHVQYFIFPVAAFVIAANLFIRHFRAKIKRVPFLSRIEKNVLIAASTSETQKITDIFTRQKTPMNVLGRIACNDEKNTFENRGNLSEINEIISKYKPDEIIFSLHDCSFSLLISTIEKITNKKVRIRTHIPNSDIII